MVFLSGAAKLTHNVNTVLQLVSNQVIAARRLAQGDLKPRDLLCASPMDVRDAEANLAQAIYLSTGVGTWAILYLVP